MQTIIYLIRHGEVDNPEKIIYGRLPNFGLTEKGKKQIENTAEFLKDKHIDKIYSSPMLRTRESAEIIQKKLHLFTVQIADEITEGLTAYEGKKVSDLDLLQSEVYLHPLSQTDETIQQLANRMQDFVKYLTEKHPGEHIVVLSHGDPIMAIKAVIKQTPLDFFSFKTDHYIQHGEVYEIIADKDQSSIKSVFKPVINE
jgi:broad specificity phosphatase PhoE